MTTCSVPACEPWQRTHDARTVEYTIHMQKAYAAWCDDAAPRIAHNRAQWASNYFYCARMIAQTAMSDSKAARPRIWERRAAEASVMAFLFGVLGKQQGAIPAPQQGEET